MASMERTTMAERNLAAMGDMLHVGVGGYGCFGSAVPETTKQPPLPAEARPIATLLDPGRSIGERRKARGRPRHLREPERPAAHRNVQGRSCYHAPCYRVKVDLNGETIRADEQDRVRGQAAGAARRDAPSHHGEPAYRDHPPQRAPQLPAAQGPVLHAHPRAGGADPPQPGRRADDGPPPRVPGLPERDPGLDGVDGLPAAAGPGLT